MKKVIKIIINYSIVVTMTGCSSCCGLHGLGYPDCKCTQETIEFRAGKCKNKIKQLVEFINSYKGVYSVVGFNKNGNNLLDSLYLLKMRVVKIKYDVDKLCYTNGGNDPDRYCIISDDAQSFSVITFFDSLYQHQYSFSINVLHDINKITDTKTEIKSVEYFYDYENKKLIYSIFDLNNNIWIFEKINDKSITLKNKQENIILNLNKN